MSLEKLKNKFRILLLSEDNTSRSQMAEGFLNALENDNLEITSAGLTSKRNEINPFAITVMKEVEIDISNNRSKTIKDIGYDYFDLVIYFCEWPSNLNLLIAGMPSYLHWPVQTPLLTNNLQETLNQYRNIRDTISNYVNTLVKHSHLEAQITEREHSQQLLDLLDDGVMIHDKSRRIYLFNRAAEIITGYLKKDVLGNDCHKVFANSGLCGSECFLCPSRIGSFNKDSEKREYKVTFTSKDGEEKRLKIRTLPFKIGPDNLDGVIANFSDITQLSELRWKQKGKYSFHGMVGHSTGMRDIFATIRQISSSNFSVLITGESGTGKELMARAIHNESKHKGGPFIAVNCGALPENILESELFGHVKGAFTGAIRDKKGRFELAHQGTIFLDEVGELTPAFQVKLLRVLQEKSFERVGGEQTITVDVRIVAATNRNLQKMIFDGTFREDLYYRLSVVPIEIPPLRNRQDDIPYLIDQILHEIKDETGHVIKSISNSAMDLILSYDWPGNIRQLINTLQFASIRASSEEITPENLPPEIRATKTSLANIAPINAPNLKQKLSPQAVKTAFEKTGGNRVLAAKFLGVGRATLYRFLDKNPM